MPRPLKSTKKTTRKDKTKNNETLPQKNKKISIKQNAFLKAYRTLGTITASAHIAGVERMAHYHWLKDDKSYPAKWAEAQEAAVDSLEQEAIKRARDGWDEPVYQGGKLVGTIKKRSDTLLIFLLKGASPEKYRERYETNSNVNLQVEVTDYSALTDAEGKK
jgi:hypothetical protein